MNQKYNYLAKLLLTIEIAYNNVQDANTNFILSDHD